MENLATNQSARLAGLKVLVIDDSKTIRRTAETLLAKEGCEVFTAVDGFDALSKIADHQPDIVFVDIMMPRLDGYQTCSLIKHNKVFRSIPVIMLSSKDGLFDRARGRIVGSEHYLTKPFTKDELLNAIESARRQVAGKVRTYGTDPHRRRLADGSARHAEGAGAPRLQDGQRRRRRRGDPQGARR